MLRVALAIVCWNVTYNSVLCISYLLNPFRSMICLHLDMSWTACCALPRVRLTPLIPVVTVPCQVVLGQPFFSIAFNGVWFPAPHCAIRSEELFTENALRSEDVVDFLEAVIEDLFICFLFTIQRRFYIAADSKVIPCQLSQFWRLSFFREFSSQALVPVFWLCFLLPGVFWRGLWAHKVLRLAFSSSV